MDPTEDTDRPTRSLYRPQDLSHAIEQSSIHDMLCKQSQLLGNQRTDDLITMLANKLKQLLGNLPSILRRAIESHRPFSTLGIPGALAGPDPGPSHSRIAKIIIANGNPTEMDALANIVVAGDLTETLPAILAG
jgi:hypothetical protein